MLALLQSPTQASAADSICRNIVCFIYIYFLSVICYQDIERDTLSNQTQKQVKKVSLTQNNVEEITMEHSI